MLDAINLEFGFWKTNLSLNILYRLRQTLWQVDATFLLTKLEKKTKKRIIHILQQSKTSQELDTIQINFQDLQEIRNQYNSESLLSRWKVVLFK